MCKNEENSNLNPCVVFMFLLLSGLVDPLYYYYCVISFLICKWHNVFVLINESKGKNASKGRTILSLKISVLC